MSAPTALGPIARVIDADAFLLLPWLEPFGVDHALSSRLLRAAAAQLLPIMPSAAERRAMRPLPPGEPEGSLTECVAFPWGLRLVCTISGGDRPEILGAVPKVSSGVQLGGRVTRVLLSPDRLQALVEINVRGVPLVFHDVHFGAFRGLYAEGAHHDFLLTALVMELNDADTPPVEVPRGSPLWRAMTTIEPRSDPSDPVFIDTSKMKAIIPLSPAVPHLMGVRGPVVAVRRWPPGDDRHQSMLYLRVACAIPPKGEEVLLDLAVPEPVLAGGDGPAKGDMIDATVMLQGRLWMADTMPDAP